MPWSRVLTSVVLSFLLSGCEDRGSSPRPDASPAVADPGPPPVTFGPRCSVALPGAPVEHLPQCTAIATVRAGAAHLYLELYPDREPAGVSRYASVVLSTSDWTPGTSTVAAGGRIEVGFADGRRYRLPASGGGEFPIVLQVSSATRAESGDHHYLRGALEATLPAVAGEGTVRFEARFP